MDFSPPVARRVVQAENLEEILATAESSQLLGDLDDFAAPVRLAGDSAALRASIELWRRKLTWALQRLIEAEARHLAGLERHAELCAHRDAVCRSVVRRLANLRRTCSGWLGEGVMELLGFAPGRVPRSAGPLLRMARQIETGLANLDAETCSAEWLGILREQSRSLALGGRGD